VAAAAGASAYASAKAAANHLGRCLALEGAPEGIRVNIVNPDAVIKGSKIWDGDWRKERAASNKIDAGEELEAHYRNRSMLKRDVLPEDIAEAAYFLGRKLGKVDRQHDQCGRRQRSGLHALNSGLGEDFMSNCRFPPI
jgi:NAD(P)-dependent dehydrogenase (short-subunit alcohol dehydrogenase family)